MSQFTPNKEILKFKIEKYGSLVKLILFLIVLVMPYLTLGQKNDLRLNGSWQGIVVADGDSQIVVVDIFTDSVLKVTYNMPWLGIKDLKTTKPILKNDSISFMINSLQIIFEGVVNYNKNSIQGDIKQGKKYPLTLNLTANPIRINRPQTPLEPFPYLTEEVIVYNKKSKINLSGTITIPNGKGPFPAVVLVSGSGPQDRDEEILGHKPFLVIADFLTKNGVAVLRYDDRGVGKSTGKFNRATTTDLASDANSVFNFLLSDKRVNKDKIGIIGHSEGGIIAPMVASKSKKVKFIILLAGTGVIGKELMIEQYRAIMQSSAIPDSIAIHLLNLNKKSFDIVLQYDGIKEISKKINLVTDSTIQLLGVENSKKYNLSKNTANQLIFQLTTPWMKEFLSLDPNKYLSKVKCPILALNGENDLQVPYLQNIPAIQSAVLKNKKGKLKTKTFPKLNHLFQTCISGLPKEYGRIEETINKEVLDEIIHFIQQL